MYYSNLIIKPNLYLHCYPLLCFVCFFSKYKKVLTSQLSSALRDVWFGPLRSPPIRSGRDDNLPGGHWTLRLQPAKHWKSGNGETRCIDMNRIELIYL